MSVPATKPEAIEGAGLEALEAQLRRDLECLNYPPGNWVPLTSTSTADRVADIVVIGGGMCGLAASFSMMRLGLRNLRIFDRNPAGLEGPWVTYARMETLRSPKQLTGPAAGMGSLTFRAWYQAQYGQAAWERLGKIPRPMWMDYLRWYRRVLALPVENGVEVLRITPVDGLFRLDLAGAAEPFVLARKVVMATGRSGLGDACVPDFLQRLPRERWAHSADEIDFEGLRGRRVVVVGAGASAMDNAATVLEHGAKELRVLIRRREMPCVNKLMGIGSPGFTCGFPTLGDHWRWRFMHYSMVTQTPAPRDSMLRVSRHPNASFHLGSGVESVRLEDGELKVETSRRKVFSADFIIAATGFAVEPAARPELDGYNDKIAVWADRYTPPEELAHAELSEFPYLGPAFEFMEKAPGSAPWLGDIHCFNHAASLSLGKVSGDIPAVSEGASWLAQGIAAALYRRDVERHWQALLDYRTPELKGDEWTDAEA